VTQCTLCAGAPAKEVEDTQRLGKAFLQELGGGTDYGIATTKTIAVICAKS